MPRAFDTSPVRARKGFGSAERLVGRSKNEEEGCLPAKNCEDIVSKTGSTGFAGVYRS
ncbi:hypothetical protein AruPA_03170 [Acidiphilium sp. PA]|uniref:hypothetical protein n=1 Tax=Acidiphilium sp. PA TaxID=2871705 RepID=UPI002243229C|nr:hypothetical protein [Acidiphilium sp. PA]MCW8306027.1 hypothetical protein [Acidiphilium sp. PA]